MSMRGSRGSTWAPRRPTSGDEALVEGITRSIKRAHESMVPARLFLSSGELLEASINRSPSAYLNNPQEERDRYLVMSTDVRRAYFYAPVTRLVYICIPPEDREGCQAANVVGQPYLSL